MSDGYYYITLVVHDQADSIDQHVLDYQARLSLGGLPDIPFHMVDLLHGHGDYEGMDLGSRKGLFSRFGALVRRLPITYHTFSYSSYDVTSETLLSARMRRDVVDYLYGDLSRFQEYDQVVVYYDQGQQAVTSALHRAFDYMFSDMTTEYRIIRYQDYRLAQVSDYLTSIELADMRYQAGDVSKTYRRFYGPQGYFRKNILKKARSKRS